MNVAANQATPSHLFSPPMSDAPYLPVRRGLGKAWWIVTAILGEKLSFWQNERRGVAIYLKEFLHYFIFPLSFFIQIVID
ncbi:MAG: hypothetical protein WAU91_22020 [Desulfatitalea sp.]